MDGQSPYFINNAERQAAVLENVAIVPCDQKVSAIADLLPLLKAVANPGEPLPVVAEDVDADVLATLVLNSVRAASWRPARSSPGLRRAAQGDAQDMAIVTSGTVISSGLGLMLVKATQDHLGRARGTRPTRSVRPSWNWCAGRATEPRRRRKSPNPAAAKAGHGAGYGSGPDSRARWVLAGQPAWGTRGDLPSEGFGPVVLRHRHSQKVNGRTALGKPSVAGPLERRKGR